MSVLTHITNFTNLTDRRFLWCEDRWEGIAPWACINVVFVVFGLPAVVVVLWDMLQRGRQRAQFTPYEVFTFNANLMDGIYLLFCVPEVINTLHGKNSDFRAFLDFLFLLGLCGRPLFTTCICVDCYLAVVHPVVYHANKSLTPRVLTAVGVWTLTLICGGISVKFPNLIDNVFQIMFFALTLPVIGYCDVSIFWTLKRSNPAGGAVHPKKKRALQIIVNNLVITFTSYLPPVISTLAVKFLDLDPASSLCSVMYPVMCSMLVGNSVTPILYMNSLGKLDWLKRLCKK